MQPVSELIRGSRRKALCGKVQQRHMSLAIRCPFLIAACLNIPLTGADVTKIPFMLPVGYASGPEEGNCRHNSSRTSDSSELVAIIHDRMATITSPASVLGAAVAVKSSGKAPASEAPMPAETEQKNAVGGVVEKGDVDDNMGLLYGLKKQEAREDAVSPLGCLALSMVAIKPEH